ncbi:addiction module killer protein [Alcanivorax sp. 521-1]|uniref:Addiction module killer protein n=2 Tax=Alloalcanivorax profundimaris TaxID=2735259 RepID=A0ABS0AW48_9GAMM|nr:addiction module killer protein [Alloalcanivorax profundimaris]
MARLRDPVARGLIIAAVQRLVEGLPVDTKGLGPGLGELRVHYGPGYRVYFHRRRGRLVLLLCGGNKGSQKRDLRRAERILKEWSKDHG